MRNGDDEEVPDRLYDPPTVGVLPRQEPPVNRGQASTSGLGLQHGSPLTAADLTLHRRDGAGVESPSI